MLSDLGKFWGDLAADIVRLIEQFRGDVARLHTQEKPDQTLLTDADLAVEELIKNAIRCLDPDAVIVAEEETRRTTRTEVLEDPELIWIVDPIDGTAEFVRPDRVEFCSVVCALRHGDPVAALVVAPELGRGRAPLVLTADRVAGVVNVNGMVITPESTVAQPRTASVTRSRGTPPRPFEAALLAAGYVLKTRTTSQTLDMVRTAIDLRPVTDADLSLSRFSLFYRAQQKVWDGAAGLCFGAAVGHRSVDGQGQSRVPITLELLSRPEPTFDVTITGPVPVVDWFVRAALQEEP